MAWDNNILDFFLANLNLPPRNPEFVILRLEIDGCKEDYYYLDLQSVVLNMNVEEKKRLQGNRDSAMIELVATPYAHGSGSATC